MEIIKDFISPLRVELSPENQESNPILLKKSRTVSLNKNLDDAIRLEFIDNNKESVSYEWTEGRLMHKDLAEYLVLKEEILLKIRYTGKGKMIVNVNN